MIQGQYLLEIYDQTIVAQILLVCYRWAHFLLFKCEICFD